MTEIKSTVTYDEKVIQKIVGHALENIDGLLDVSGGFFSNVKEKLINSEDVTTGVNVEVGKEEVATDLDVIVEYGKDIPAIAEGIKEIIAQNVETMTHLKVIEVNINVVDIMTRKEFEEASVTVQDRVEAGYAKTKEVTAAGYERAKEATAAGYERTKEAAQNAGEYISEKSGEARDYASEKAAQAKEFTVEKASEAKKYASEQAEKAKDAMSTDSSEGVTYTASVDGDVVVTD